MRSNVEHISILPYSIRTGFDRRAAVAFLSPEVHRGVTGELNAGRPRAESGKATKRAGWFGCEAGPELSSCDADGAEPEEPSADCTLVQQIFRR